MPETTQTQKHTPQTTQRQPWGLARKAPWSCQSCAPCGCLYTRESLWPCKSHRKNCHDYWTTCNIVYSEISALLRTETRLLSGCRMGRFICSCLTFLNALNVLNVLMYCRQQWWERRVSLNKTEFNFVSFRCVNNVSCPPASLGDWHLSQRGRTVD